MGAAWGARAAPGCPGGCDTLCMQAHGGVPSLSDRRVILDQHVAGDAGPHVRGEDEETARRFGWWPKRSTEAGARAAFDRWAAQWRSGGAVRAFAVRDAGSRGLVGGCELRIQSDGSAHVSYWTSAQHRRKGYAARALALLCDYAVSIGISRLEAQIAEDNHASRRVAERAGFTEQETFTGEDGQPMVRYIRATPRI